MLVMGSTVGENEEVSIKEVADAIVKALDFKGECTVRPKLFLSSLTMSGKHWHIVRYLEIGRSVPQTSIQRKVARAYRQFQIHSLPYWFAVTLSPLLSLCYSTISFIRRFVALNTTVQWFVDNYDSARTGMKKTTA